MSDNRPTTSLFDKPLETDKPQQTNNDDGTSGLLGGFSLLGPSKKTNDNVVPRNQRMADEVNFHCERQTNVLHVKYYLSDSNRRELIKTIGDPACLLFDYYLRMASKEDREITDSDVASQFGWDIQKVQRYRRALQKNGWFRRSSFSYPDGRKGITYYIGKEPVQKSHKK